MWVEVGDVMLSWFAHVLASQSLRISKIEKYSHFLSDIRNCHLCKI